MGTQAQPEGTLPIPEIDDVEMAFPANALDWMPPLDEIPEEFKHGQTEWNRIVAKWFGYGLPGKTEFVPRDGIDAKKALRALKATLGSYAPSHEHKEAAAAYMLSCWFKKVKGWK